MVVSGWLTFLYSASSSDDQPYFHCHWLSYTFLTTNDNRFYLWLSWKSIVNQYLWYILTTMTMKILLYFFSE